MTKFQSLYEFVDRATRSRKYPESTAQTLRAALKLYEAELNDDEKNDIQKLKDNFKQISQSVLGKNASRYSASSLITYKSRMQKVIVDYEKYSDPVKMNSWSPKVIVRKKRDRETIVGTPEMDGADEAPSYGTPGEEVSSEGMHKIELALRRNTKFILVVPRDITKKESSTLKGILDSLSEDTGEYERSKE